MAENSTKKIKIITAPDRIFDQSQTMLVINPSETLKNAVHDYAVACDQHLNIYLYSGHDDNIAWLLSVANSVDNIIIDMDNCPVAVSQFFSYLLSLPHTYYKCDVMQAPWDLLNKNRFYDFPKLKEENNER
jgi:hypothetical protein